MRRFLIEEKFIKKDKVYIKGKEAHHIKDVIRLKPGDRFIGLDGLGKVYRLRVTDTNDTIKAAIEKIDFCKDDFRRILLACALPKRNKMDDIMQKATELGATDIIPMITERTIVKISAKAKTSKQTRWQKIVIEACKQSARTIFPQVHNISDFEQALQLADILGYSNRIIPFPGENENHILNFISDKIKDIAVFVGPEGDFTSKEISLAKKHGFQAVSLGPFILKVDTACCFALSILSAQPLCVKGKNQ
jgi:16S rRNA (uracil1498-N3)-methyltransferase